MRWDCLVSQLLGQSSEARAAHLHHAAMKNAPSDPPSQVHLAHVALGIPCPWPWALWIHRSRPGITCRIGYDVRDPQSSADRTRLMLDIKLTYSLGDYAKPALPLQPLPPVYGNFWLIQIKKLLSLPTPGKQVLMRTR